MKYAVILFRYSDSPITLKYFPVPLKCIENASTIASRQPKQYVDVLFTVFLFKHSRIEFVHLCNPSDFKLDI